MPMETRCVYLRAPQDQQALEYEIEGQTYQTRVFDPAMGGGAWRLEVGTVPLYSGMSLRPQGHQCHPGDREVTP
jgi:hypothetical protein